MENWKCRKTWSVSKGSCLIFLISLHVRRESTHTMVINFCYYTSWHLRVANAPSFTATFTFRYTLKKHHAPPFICFTFKDCLKYLFPLIEKGRYIFHTTLDTFCLLFRKDSISAPNKCDIYLLRLFHRRVIWWEIDFIWQDLFSGTFLRNWLLPGASLETEFPFYDIIKFQFKRHKSAVKCFSLLC